ncbi:MoaD/ThiS family protein [Flavobacterium agrisoli]|uniref:MoaD/ThiS family protein n=1 Tax=Flavobacterium agrisoli TaxID=2793066 RepID=A0A934PI91_9FLAO|nr:MoaD/ThiS family protein [Flavobacterium agrisoli]MBK0368562.1 MoaD/ThiS family protein [Flavobacterium agrisoli]
MIEVKYFGAVAEKTKCDKETFDFESISLSQIVADLHQKHQLESITYSVAVNQKIVADLEQYFLQSNDTIALLPPFAGG